MSKDSHYVPIRWALSLVIISQSASGHSAIRAACQVWCTAHHYEAKKLLNIIQRSSNQMCTTYWASQGSSGVFILFFGAWRRVSLWSPLVLRSTYNLWPAFSVTFRDYKCAHQRRMRTHFACANCATAAYRLHEHRYQMVRTSSFWPGIAACHCVQYAVHY